MNEDLKDQLEEMAVLESLYHQQDLFLNRMYNKFGLLTQPKSPKIRLSYFKETDAVYFPKQTNFEGEETSSASIIINANNLTRSLISLFHEDSHHLHYTFIKGINWTKNKFNREVIAELGTIIYLQEFGLLNYWQKHYFKEKESPQEFHKIQEKVLELFKGKIPLIDIIKKPEVFIKS